MRIAHEWARKVEGDSNRAAHSVVFGFTVERSLGELANALHMAKEADWSRKQVVSQRRFRDFWLAGIGAEAVITDVSPAQVEALARSIEGSAETRKKYLRWIKQAYRFAERKLKWIDPRHNMDGVDLPKVRSASKPYTLKQVQALLPALEAISDEAGWMGHAAWQSGRRRNALRTIPTSAVECFEDHTVVTFPEETDKAARQRDDNRYTGQVVLVGRAHALSRQLVEKGSTYLLGDDSPPTKHLVSKVWIMEAERSAGVPHVPGRGWHGIKRRASTEAKGVVGRGNQFGTREDTLDNTYVQDDIHPKRVVAQRLSDAVTVSIVRQGSHGDHQE